MKGLHSVKTMPKGKTLSFTSVRAGDILAFGTSTGYSGHVALYIGAGMMVVAHKPGTRLAEIHVSTDVGSKNTASQHIVRVVRP
jgi:cell wall-associated NlpC family hydrolase